MNFELIQRYRHNGIRWGGGVQILPSGRRIYRHSSNEGSVIEFNYWGTWKSLFVADAKYRAANTVYAGINQPYGNPQLTVTDEWFNGSQDANTETLTYTKDDAWIQSTYAELKNDGTAKSNTDTLVVLPITLAASHCRGINISDVGQLDLPNLYELIILYLESDYIDALDPTVESNRDKALGKMNTNGRFNPGGTVAIWSSTESTSGSAWFVNSRGRAYSNLKDSPRGVAPVKELEGWILPSGRKIYRHPSNEGSVIEFDYWGT